MGICNKVTHFFLVLCGAYGAPEIPNWALMSLLVSSCMILE